MGRKRESSIEAVLSVELASFIIFLFVSSLARTHPLLFSSLLLHE